jgi:hypothetical protein
MVQMRSILRTPNPELVRAACEVFESDNNVAEQALGELFGLFPTNADLPHVLLKVVVLNRLYSTQIFAVMDVARHIYANAEIIDRALACGSPEIVEAIAKVTIQGKIHNFFSFAAKYCSWHQAERYPIYDSRVDRYLWLLQKQEIFTGRPFVHDDLWDYSKFLG